MKKSSTMKKVVVSSTFATGLILASPLAADAALGDQTLRSGMNHPDVIELQDALKSKGYFTFERSTGFFGTITEEAVRDFQRKHNLQVDGIAGPQTISALKSMGGQATTASTATTTQASTTSNISISAILRNGSTGTQVRNLQQSLKDKGYYTSTVDGQFGRLTETAVRNYQRANNLTADGIAGPQTLGHLNGAQASTSGTVTETRNEQTANAVVTNPAPAPSASGSSTTLRVGTSGTAVTNLQAQLRSLGLFDRQPTGYYGEVTATSVRNFQRANNLTADGIAGPKTISRLNELATNQPSTPAATAPATNTSTSTTPAPSRTGSGSAALVTNIVAEAANHIGVPYLWGGTTTRGFDCSGFVQYTFNQQGLSIPRTVAQQWNAGRTVSQPAVGDLVFFDTTGGPSHNGIYIGNNQFIHSGSSTGVTIASMNNSYWAPRYIGAKRLH